MDRGAWWAAVHGVERVRHNLVTKPPPQLIIEKMEAKFTQLGESLNPGLSEPSPALDHWDILLCIPIYLCTLLGHSPDCDSSITHHHIE